MFDLGRGMNFLTIALIVCLLLTVGFGALFVFSFAKPSLTFSKPNWIFLGLAIAFSFATVIAVFQFLNSTPGQVKVVDEEKHDGPTPVIPKSSLDRLRLEWDSESVANWPAAETLADISEIAYQSPFEAATSYRELGFTDCMPVVQGSMIGYVITGDDVTVVAFRGTDFSELSDWMANLGRSPTPTDHGDVHKGFYFAYQSMKPQVVEILKTRDTTNLWVTGHSLGGALALLCAYDLESIEDRKLNGVVTFGQPMVARQQFATHIDRILLGRYARFVNRDDIVPKVPPSHVACGSLVWFKDTGIKRSKPKRVMYGLGNPNQLPVGATPVSGSNEEAEIQPLSEAEFEALQAKLKATNETAQRLPEDTPVMMNRRAMTSMRLIDDHMMNLYLDKIQRLLGIAPASGDSTEQETN